MHEQMYAPSVIVGFIIVFKNSNKYLFWRIRHIYRRSCANKYLSITCLKMRKRVPPKIFNTQRIAHLIVINLRRETRGLALVGVTLWWIAPADLHDSALWLQLCLLAETGRAAQAYLRKREEPCVTLELALVALHFIGSPPLSSIVISATFLLEAFYVS